jgi:hypothetical protein
MRSVNARDIAQKDNCFCLRLYMGHSFNKYHEEREPKPSIFTSPSDDRRTPLKEHLEYADRLQVLRADFHLDSSQTWILFPKIVHRLRTRASTVDSHFGFHLLYLGPTIANLQRRISLFFESSNGIYPRFFTTMLSTFLGHPEASSHLIPRVRP